MFKYVWYFVEIFHVYIDLIDKFRDGISPRFTNEYRRSTSNPNILF